jgi:hypothetical protein
MTFLEDQMEVAGLEEENSDESTTVDELEGSDYETWETEHIEAALCIIFGGAQYKAGTNLWAIK